MANANIAQAAAYLRRAADDKRSERDQVRRDIGNVKQGKEREVSDKEHAMHQRGRMATNSDDSAARAAMGAEMLRLQRDAELTKAEMAREIGEMERLAHELEGQMNDLIRRAGELDHLQ